jgi:uncharacterized membrane protein
MSVEVETFADQAKESAEKSPTSLLQRWVIRVFLGVSTLTFLVVGVVLLVIGGKSVADIDKVLQGIVLLVIFVIFAIVWSSLACCCGHKWVCSKD